MYKVCFLTRNVKSEAIMFVPRNVIFGSTKFGSDGQSSDNLSLTSTKGSPCGHFINIFPEPLSLFFEKHLGCENAS